MKKITLGELVDFFNLAIVYIRRNPNERTRLTYALNKLTCKYEGKIKEFNSRVEEIRNDAESEFCLKDKHTGAFLEREVKNADTIYFRKQFDRQGEESKRNKIESEILSLRSRQVDFEPYIIDIPYDFDMSFLTFFTGFIFSKMSEEDELDWYLKQENKPISGV